VFVESESTIALPGNGSKAKNNPECRKCKPGHTLPGLLVEIMPLKRPTFRHTAIDGVLTGITPINGVSGRVYTYYVGQGSTPCASRSVSETG